MLRLTKHDPKDFSLKYIFAYDFAGYRAYNAYAMQWAQEYRKAFPNKLAGLFLLAAVYEAQFGLQLSEAKGKQAIDYYNQYLQVVPDTDLWEAQAKLHIERTKQRIERFRKKGKLKA